MWYSRIKEAGALDVLQGDLEIKSTIEDTLRPYKYVSSVSSLPNSQSIYEYCNREIDKFQKTQYDYNEISDIRLIFSFLTKIMNFYVNSPKTADKFFDFVPLIAKLYQKTNNGKRIIKESIFPIYDVIGLRVGNDLHFHNKIYNLGFARIYNFYKEGIEIPDVMKTYLLLRIDLLSSNELSNNESREKLINLIIEKNPSLEVFDIRKHSGQEIISSVKDNFDLMPLFLRSGIPYNDFFDIIELVFNKISNFELDEDRFERLLDDGLFSFDLSGVNEKIKFYELLSSYKDKISKGIYKSIFIRQIDDFENFPLNDEFYEIVNKDKDLILSRWRMYYYKEKLFGYGIYKDLCEYVAYYLKVDKQKIANYFHPNAIPTKEQIESCSKPVPELRDVEIKEQVSKDNIFQKFIDNGDIEEKTFHDPEMYRILENVSYSLNFDEKDEPILNDIKNIARIYVFKNSNFYDYLKKNYVPPVYGFIGTDSSKALGYFHPKFSKDLKSNFHPAIFLNEFLSNVEGNRIFANLGITSDQISGSTFAHEVSHMIDFVVKGGREVWQKFDPQNWVEAGKTYNKSRLYLSDVREIVARVYGDVPYMSEVLHKQIEDLRSNKLIIDAVISEMVEGIQRTDFGILEGFPSRQYLIDMLEAGVGGPSKSEKPMEAVKKKYDRRYQALFEKIRQQGESKKRDITLEILKQLRDIEKQLEILSNRAEDVETRQKLESDKLKLQEKMKLVRQGAFNFDIDVVIKTVASHIAFDSLKVTNEIVSDPSYNPPMSIVDSTDENRRYFQGDTSPLTDEELRTFMDYDIATVSGGEKGGISLRERKLRSPLPLDISYPKWREVYPETFEKEKDVRKEEDKFTEKQSFNYRRWLR